MLPEMIPGEELHRIPFEWNQKKPRRSISIDGGSVDGREKGPSEVLAHSRAADESAETAAYQENSKFQ